MINSEIEEVKSIVTRYFDVYDFRILPDHLEFYITFIDERTLEKNFEELRLKFKKRNLVPLLRRKGGEYFIAVMKTRSRKYRSIYINVILLLLTIASTIWVGMGYYSSYYGVENLWHQIWGGFLYFSLPLLTILGSHEMGHYFAAKKHKVAASLPFFIPAPTILGTLGAFISMRDPIPDRKSLVDIGLAGPITGFIVAIPVTLVGLYIGHIHPPAPPPITTTTLVYIFNLPLIYQLFFFFIPPSQFIHPVAMAGWVGFVVTAINLFPIGQLDGGHVARALAGDKAKYISYAFAAVLIALSYFYLGWLIFALLVIFLGLRHPPPLNDIVKLDKKRVALAISGFLILAVTFVPVPIEVAQAQLEVNVWSNITTLIEDLNEQATLKLWINNTGDLEENVTVKIKGNLIIPQDSISFILEKGGGKAIEENVSYLTKGSQVLHVMVKTSFNLVYWRNITFQCFERSSTLYFSPNIASGHMFNITLKNNGPPRVVSFLSLNNVSFNITNHEVPLYLERDSSYILNFVVMAPTTILAIDKQNYEVAWFKVEI